MANQNIEMKHLNGSGTYDTLYPKTLSTNTIISDTTATEMGLSSGATVDQALSTLQSNNTTIEESMTSLKTSVSEGKALVAAAVTDKGVETAANSSFSTIANNIGNISTLVADTESATATASQILSGYTAYAKGSKITGTYIPVSLTNNLQESKRYSSSNTSGNYSYVKASFNDFPTDKPLLVIVMHHMASTYYKNVNVSVYYFPAQSNSSSRINFITSINNTSAAYEPYAQIIDNNYYCFASHANTYYGNCLIIDLS